MSTPSAESSTADIWRKRRTLALWNIASAIGLLLLGGLNLLLLEHYPSLIGWLPAGAGLGLVLIKGPRLLPGVFVGVALTGLLGLNDPDRALQLGAEALLTCAATWYLLNRRHLFDLAQNRISDVGLMLLVATLLSTSVATVSGPRDWSAPPGIATGRMPAPAAAGHPPQTGAGGGTEHTMPGTAAPAMHHLAPPSLLAWGLADAIGILLIVPLALRGYRWSQAHQLRLTGDHLAATAILGVLIGVTAAIYSGVLEARFGIRHTTLLILPPAVWLALKYDLGFTIAGNFFIFLLAGIGTSLGHGPFADHTAGLPLLTFITLFTTLLIAAGRTERQTAEDTIHRMATEDPLTGLPNRHALNQRLALALGNAKRYKHQVAVMFIDLDNFKQANDAFGHEIGDRLLIEASRKLAGSLRGDSMLARFGGDEFIALIDHVEDPSALDIVGQRMIDALAAPIFIDGHECRISCSGGIAIFPGDGENAVDLLKNADIAMYHVKSRGRNGFLPYSRIPVESGSPPLDRRVVAERARSGT